MKHADANQVRDDSLITLAVHDDIAALIFLADNLLHKVLGFLDSRLERVHLGNSLQTFHHVGGGGLEFLEHPRVMPTHLVEHLPLQVLSA